MNHSTNPQLDLAYKYVCHTNKPVFLTGKAGTGKTTFLHRIKTETKKRMAVVAPTGVAAINAKGVTIHSLFQLPFGPLVPGQAREEMKKRRFSGDKIKLLRSLDLLVIDEISMVRADVLDAIDAVLRRYCNYTKPFGGVQLLMIGDLHQLPPVVRQQEWELLKPHYDTAYFFGSHALKKTNAVTIELTHIYRQSDATFIELLNKVRDNKMDDAVLQQLNSRYQEGFKPKEKEGYITLTSHNATAQEINRRKLKDVSGKSYHFKAEIKGDFPAHSYPTAVDLEFKVGAQVMFVKNDVSGDKQYYNGKIGTITKIDRTDIYVRCPGDNFDITVFQAEWRNMKYTLNKKTKEVLEEELGTFIQHPLKLAWAITIHKSQGLTFERVIIDAQAAFAHGQVYVALSRCKSFEGIVLRSKIGSTSVKTDSVVRNYTEENQQNPPDEQQLLKAKKEYQQELLYDLFDGRPLNVIFNQLERAILEHNNSLAGSIEADFIAFKTKAGNEVIEVAGKFARHLTTYFQEAAMPEENQDLKERLQKASAYFIPKIEDELLPDLNQLQILTDNQTVEKKVTEKVEALRKAMVIKIAGFKACLGNFTANNYVKAIVDADLDFKKTKTQAKTAAVVPNKTPKDIEHPALYEILSNWRAQEAEKEDVKLFSVATTKSLIEIAEVRPVTSYTLKKIHGIGKVKVEKYGAAIIEIVQQYSADHQLKTDQLHLLTGTIKRPPNTDKRDTKIITMELFKEGKSIKEIAETRSLAESTITGHLSHYVSIGELEVTKFLKQEKLDKIVTYFEKAEEKGLSQAIKVLGSDFTYGDLRMGLAFLKTQEVDNK